MVHLIVQSSYQARSFDSIECSEDVFSYRTIVTVENSRHLTAGSDSCDTSSESCLALLNIEEAYSINIRHADTVWPNTPVQYYPNEICT